MDYLFHIGDGDHFKSSSTKSIWGIASSQTVSKAFIANAKKGDRLWFVKSKTNGQLIAVATFTEMKKRELGPLISLTLTNEELGWNKTHGSWDVEVHYKDLYNITECNLKSEIKGASVIRKYNDKCKVNLPEIYPHIVRFSKITKSM